MSRVLIFEEGRVREEPLDQFCALPAEPPFSWVHIDGREEDAASIARRLNNMPETALNALVAQETRPRCAMIGDGAIVNLRGLGETLDSDSDPLVSIRLWAEKARVISVSYRHLGVLDQVIDQMKRGDIRDPGDLIACLGRAITDDLDPDVAELGDTLDDIESSLSEDGPAEARRRVSRVRAAAISYRRFIAPQRQALERLALADASWLEDEDRLHLQDAADRCARMAEELEAVRERAALAHDGLTDLRAEHMNRQALIISIVALVFLPLTFVTGLLGMNVQGIPFAHEPWAFWGVVAFCALLAAGVGGWFIARHWVRN